MKRVIFGAVAAGIVVFLWGAVSHMLLPIGNMGLKMLPDEQILSSELQAKISEPGVYIIPGFDPEAELSPEAEAEWQARYEEGPNAFLVYQPKGRTVLSPVNFLWEILSSIFGAFLAAFIVYKSGAQRFWCRFGVVSFMGAFAWLTISIPYWNWYRFPWDFTFAQGIDEIVGWCFGALVIAWLVKPSSLDSGPKEV